MSGAARRKALSVLLILGLLTPLGPVAGVRAGACTDVEMVWARGTSQPVNSQFEFQVFNDRLRERVLPGASYTSEHELGTGSGYGGFKYPAAGETLDLALQHFAAFLGGPYADSVAQGRSELVAYLTDRVAACPSTAFVLAGHSQGAQVIGDALPLLAAETRARIAFVSLFGDPKFNAGNISGPSFPITPTIPIPFGCISPPPWVRGSAPCFVSGGIFGPRDPYVPADIDQRVGSWCRNGDPSCDGSLADVALSFAEHEKYFDERSDSAFAALQASLALQAFLPAHQNDFDVSWFSFAAGMTGADLGVVFDTTGSMGPYIADAKANATGLAQTWIDTLPNGRVGLVEYRDQGDPFVARLDLGLTNNVNDFQTAVNALVASGGGDTPEAALSGGMTALNNLQWLNGATKVLVYITDAPGKDPEPITGYTTAQLNQRSLEIDPVAIYTVNVSNNSGVNSFFTPIANATAGQVFVLQPGQTLSDALFAVIDTVANNPVANLNGPYLAAVSNPVSFNTYPSFDPDATLTSFEWDFNADGVVDQTTSVGQVQHTYAGTYHGLASVRVISSDGGSALATAQVDVDNAGLTGQLPIAPTSASATVTGTNQVTVTWTPASNDRSEGYQVYLADGTLVGATATADPHSFTVQGLDLSQPTQFQVVASNRYGHSGGVVTQPVGAIEPEVSLATASARFIPPPPCNPCPQAPAVGTVVLTASGNVTAAGGTVTVDYRLWGITSGGGSVLAADWAPATPADGAFDSPAEAFTIGDSSNNAGYTDYDLDVRATAAGVSTMVTQSVPIEHDTTPPTSRVDPLPASTTTSTYPITVTAGDNWSGLWLNVDLWYRYRKSTNNPWGPWVFPMSDSTGPYSFSFGFPNGKGYYEFYSIATDQSGNVEAPPASADAWIQKK